VKKTLLTAIVGSLALGAAALLAATPSSAREDHRPYNGMRPAECNECHEGSHVTPNHQSAWNAEHRVIAVKADAPCADCHDQAYCQDCHYGGGITAGLAASNDRGADTKPKSHRSSFLEIHPIAAFDSPNSCSRCHPASYCRDCHARFRPEDLMFQSHRKGWSDSMPGGPGHPRHATFPPDSCQTCHPGSVLPAHQWSGAHAQEARRNLPTCQGCHADGQICLTCHSARTGLRVNPHPDNWGDIKDRINKAAGQRTCVKCH